jgi:hypothetical protein
MSSPKMGDELLVQRAKDALSAGRALRIEVGNDPEDPVLIVRLEDGCVMSHAIRGWSAGVVEPVCAIDSDYLAKFVTGRKSVRIVESCERCGKWVPSTVFSPIPGYSNVCRDCAADLAN